MVFDEARHPFLKMLQVILRLFYHRHLVSGTDHVQPGEPAVFICNHLRSYAPIVVSLYLPFRFRPWVQANVVSPELCRDYIEEDFVKKELHFHPPSSRWLASVIAPLCVRLMKSIRAIPVYRGRRKILETFTASVEALQQGMNLVIFPESKSKTYSTVINDFQTGFAWLAWRYFQETGRHIRFYPVYVDTVERKIMIGRPVSLSDEEPPAGNRKEMAARLRDAVNAMAVQR